MSNIWDASSAVGKRPRGLFSIRVFFQVHLRKAGTSSLLYGTTATKLDCVSASNLFGTRNFYAWAITRFIRRVDRLIMLKHWVEVAYP